MTLRATIELAACPFCNGKADIEDKTHGDPYVYCVDCGVMTAPELWNRRAIREELSREPNGWVSLDERAPWVSCWQWVTFWNPYNEGALVTVRYMVNDVPPRGATHWRFVEPPSGLAAPKP